MATRESHVTKMIERVAKRRECSQAEAIEYMLDVATGRLAALWKYAKESDEKKPAKKKSAPKKKKAAKAEVTAAS